MRFVSNPHVRAAAPAEGFPADTPAAKPAGCPRNSAMVDVTVVPDTVPLKVEPDSVEIFLEAAPGKAALVCWTVHGLAAGETLHLAGKEGAPDLFPDLERTIKAPRTTAVSGHASAAGTWRYSLWITRGESPDKHHLTDPEVIVRGDGG